jgi:L-threonylcarbamoyladenylate synthase
LRLVSPWRAAELLREGRVGLVPTETVVGLVADIRGLPRLFEIKERDPDKPIAILCPSAESALLSFREVQSLAWTLAERFWPGPLTLVLDAASGETIGLRVADHRAVQEILARRGPMYATSANLSGRTAPTALKHVDPRVASAVDFAVPGTPGTGEASAVVSLSGGRVELLRPGAGLTQDKLLRLADAQACPPSLI